MAANKKYYLLTFTGQGPEWRLFDGERTAPVEAPSGRAVHPVIALIPDRYLFYYLPSGLKGKKGRAVQAAIALQTANLFPIAALGGDSGLLKRSGSSLLSFFAHPDLKQFIAEHKNVLAKANLVTSAFVLAWTAAGILDSDYWVWESPEGYRAIFADDSLHYLRGGEDELKARLQGLETEGEPLLLDLDKSLEAFADNGGRLSSLRLPLATAEGEGPRNRGYLKAAVLIALVGLLFVGGEVLRLRYLKAEAGKWKTAVHNLYASALGPDYGNDPYGKLLFRIDQIKSGSGLGFDTLDVLAYLSQKAPEGMKVQEMNLSGESGVIKAEVSSYAQLEAFLKTLGDSPGYRFTLDQATNSPEGVIFGLKVEFNK